MTNCLGHSDLQELSSTMFVGFEQRVLSIPGDLCAPFFEEARQLETELLSIYRMVALCARKEQDLACIAKGWEFMVNVCDQAAARLSKLSEQHPYCGAVLYFDRVLDLRNKCRRLQEIHS
jgi:hypothetical protein